MINVERVQVSADGRCTMLDDLPAQARRIIEQWERQVEEATSDTQVARLFREMEIMLGGGTVLRLTVFGAGLCLLMRCLGWMRGALEQS